MPAAPRRCYEGMRGVPADSRSLTARMKAPEKELRFTRSRQAIGFFLGGALLLFVALGLGYVKYQRLVNPPAWWVPVIPLVPGAALLWLGWRLTRHAYLLFSPVGIEIFPFYKPVKNYQLVPWSDVGEATVDPAAEWLTIKFAGLENAGIILTLKPIDPRRRLLLARTVAGVMKRRAGNSEEIP